MMKKYVIGFSTLLFLASAVPALAQDVQQAPAAKTINTSIQIGQNESTFSSYIRCFVAWNAFPGARYYEISVFDMTTNQLSESSRFDRSSINHTATLEPGHNYHISVRALDQNLNTIGSSHATIMGANPSNTYLLMNLI
ncbi:hypothetical protein [Paenibacillus sp. 481]|uniref:hypothetical protein n=1 Tax=Paenibacillus sp. 481 TaxID=2835869 RepID=UPI001E634178|nr:hypothetical protein [Paenibacillus sp. 481]UHA73259.1 hypothetical protein KIK04_22215 [Paenibacillus sp. 481]